MRLTNSDRDAFVRAVMDDVPHIDYDDLAREIVTPIAAATLPEPLRPFVISHPNLFKTFYVSMPGSLCSIWVVRDPDLKDDFIRAEHKDVWRELDRLAQYKHKQKEARAQLNQQVAATIAGCTTLKQATERLPEFIKYLPKDRDGFGTANLPVVSNLVANLTKAGWPKGTAST